jgi:hypothetical protein
VKGELMSKFIDRLLRVLAVILWLEWILITAMTPSGIFIAVGPWLALLAWVTGGWHNAKDDAVNEVNPVNPLVETSFCHTHGEYSGPICPDCKSPLDMEMP